MKIRSILSILCLGLLFACGDGGLRATSSADIALEPELILDDTGAEYASVVFERPGSVGRFKENVLKIKNSGIEDLIITSIEIQGKPDCDRRKLGVSPKQPFANAEPSRPDLDTPAHDG